MSEDTSSRFSTILGVFGAILIGCGVAWLVATNWHWLSAPLKIFILVGSTAGVFAGALMLGMRGHAGLSGALNLLGAHLFTLSIFLIAQIFSTSASLQGTAHLFLLSWAGCWALAYILKSSSCLIVSLTQILIWVGIQFFAFIVSEDINTFDLLAIGWLGVSYLITGVLFFALSLFHAGKPFSHVYRWWSSFYILLLSFLLSFHFILVSVWDLMGTQYDPALDPDAFFGTGLLLPSALRIPLLVFAAFSVVALLFSISKNREDKRIIKGGIFLLIGTAVFLFLPISLRGTVGKCVEKPCYEFNNDDCSKKPGNNRCAVIESSCRERACYNYSSEALCKSAPSDLKCDWKENWCQSIETATIEPLDECRDQSSDFRKCIENSNCNWRSGYYYRFESDGVTMSNTEWLIWIGANFWLLVSIVAVVGYGVVVGSRGLVNLAIAAFALQIISRYIGFMIDYWGYTSLSFVFISGGIILIFGGIGIQKWRRYLLKKTQANS